MSGVSFPRESPHSGYAPSPGHPLRANACRCDEGPLLFKGDDQCARCGKYEASTISGTWAERAQSVARIAKARAGREAHKRGRRRP